MQDPKDADADVSLGQPSPSAVDAYQISPEQFVCVQNIFYQALDRPPEERSAFVRQVCGDDSGLIAIVEFLLANDEAAGSFLETPAVVRIEESRVPILPMLTPRQRLGPYEIAEAIGAGGMGEVYRARDIKLERDVAIKILPVSFAKDPERLQRFEREARVLAALNHAHIGAIYGLEESGDLRALVLELVAGETLAEKLGHESRGLPIGEALSIARQIAEALDAAHEKGIIHRDLKPANIKITPQGVVKVLDFGLAKWLIGDSLPADFTHLAAVPVGGTVRGVILGTVGYMSPEQARGKVVDKRTDIWAFGCVLYELLTGCAAFSGETHSDILAAVLERAPDWARLPDSVPPAIRRLLQRCLEKDPTRRIRDIGDIPLELEDVAISATTSPVEQSREPAAVSQNRSAWLAGIGLVVLITAVVLVRSMGTPRTAAPTFTRVTQLTSGQALESGPAISPDGKWIAYLSNARGPTDVWVKFLAGGDSINLTAATTLEIQSRIDLGGLSISPDGALIAFDAGATKGTPPYLFDAWVIPAPVGGTPRKMVELGRTVRWSPDGLQILFIRPGSSAGDALLVAGADGGSGRELVSVRGGMHIHWPVWSRDGRYIYFNYSISTSNSEPAEIYRVPTAGGPIEPIISSARRAVFPVPTPDGAGLIYSANPFGVDLALWWRPLDRQEPVRLTTGVGEYAETSIAADGRSMIATLVVSHLALTVFPISDKASTVPRTITDGFTGDIDPVLSPDGERLVFSSSRSGYRNLWTARPDGTMPRALTSGNAFDERPAFSRDGQRLAFVSDRGGQRGIWTMNADGGIPQQLVKCHVIDRLEWSPSGRHIVYADAVGNSPRLRSVDVADGTIQPFPAPGPALSPTWLANDTIAYLEPFPGGPGKPNVNRVALVRVNDDPVPAEALRGLNLGNGFIVASHNGHHLAGIVDPGGAAGSIWVADVESGNPFRKVADLPSDVRPRGATWTADDGALIVGTVRRTSHLVLFDQAN